MSTRRDFYLSLCLQQATKSPLHYRHGCIIVRGGKVIGQGYNTYRSGFDGGALKHGNIVKGQTGPLIHSEDYLKHDKKAKSKSKSGNKQASGNFTPFEDLGNGHYANKPLSMHSEMMAIQSALSLSSGTQSSQMSARSAKSWQKPFFKVQSASKRKARLRGLKAYVKAVCAKATKTRNGKHYSGKFSLQESRFEPDSSQPSRGGVRWGQRGDGGYGRWDAVCVNEEWPETPMEEE